MSEEKYELVNNFEANQFEFHIEGSIAKVEYKKKDDKIYLTHTEVPDELEGKGIGSALAHATLEEVSRLDLTLVVLCPFIAKYIDRHPEWQILE